jgi:hypothetical protein
LYCGPCFAQRIESAHKAKQGRRNVLGRWKGALLTMGSLACLVAGFYLLGRMLAAIPADVHDGTVWKKILNP